MRAARRKHWCARTPYGLAVLRYRQAGLLLRDRRLRQGSHAWPSTMGLRGAFADFWTRSIISQEGTSHKALRQIAMAALAPDYIASLVPEFERIAQELIIDLKSEGACEFIEDFTEPFAGRAITALLGLPDYDASQIAKDASALGLAMGLDAKSHESVFNASTDRLIELSRHLIQRVREGRDNASFTARAIAAAPSDTEDQVLIDLIVITIFGGVDTTRAQLGFAAAIFAEHPDQWTQICNDSGLVPQAIEEVIRARPTTTWSTREAVEDFVFDGVDIACGDTLHMLVHATGTDPQIDPDWQFDINAKRKSHFGFGGGAHHCLGQLVARTDMAAALKALSETFTRIEWAGDPIWLPDSGNTSPAHLPLKFIQD